MTHRVRIRLEYANEGLTPWKWRGRCECGWQCLSWAWMRTPEYGYEGEEATGGGTLRMSLEHLEEKSQSEAVGR